MLPLTQQEKSILAALIGVILVGSAGQWLMKMYPLRAKRLDFMENWGGQEKVDINRAGRAELMRLPHIGPARAETIVRFRLENGPFESISQLRRVPGIGPKIFEKIKPRLFIQKP